jgi:hypothetical protein
MWKKKPTHGHSKKPPCMHVIIIIKNKAQGRSPSPKLNETLRVSSSNSGFFSLSTLQLSGNHCENRRGGCASILR